MAFYKAGVVGPIPLEDGRVITAEQGPFELDIDTPHDQDLLERGVIVLADIEQPEQKPAPPAQTPPVAGASAPSGEKAGGE